MGDIMGNAKGLDFRSISQNALVCLGHFASEH